ncbi:hypothetical protein HQ560_02790 [bacterium]|nr:hypothetical protein [bacterium]
MTRHLLTCALLLLPCLGLAGESKDAAEKLTRAQRTELQTLFAQFGKAKDKETRGSLFEKMIAMGSTAARGLRRPIDETLALNEKKYAQLLARHIPTTYRKRLIALTNEQIRQVQATRRLWKHYILTTASQPDFQKNFLAPCFEVAEILLLDMDNVKDETIKAQRDLLHEYAGYQSQCHKALGISIDPTKTKKSPTGIPYPELDEPPTFRDKLSHLERTLVLVHSVAPAGAKPVLLGNDKAAREIDVQEAEFVLFANEARMLMGTIAWMADPLVCAVARDHSNDRKEGNASGHMSKVPGKHGFTDRIKRMGARWCGSEGAGGGGDGRGYIRGLSYGGGHTGPLYSLKRNVTGVGRRGGVYTSMYATDKSIVHPCAATSGELFMPPGLSRKDLHSSDLKSIYRHLHGGNYAAAQSLIAQARPGSATDKMLLRFFAAYVQVEMDWFFKAADGILAVGDVYEVKMRTDDARRRFGRLPAFQEKLKPLAERLATEDAAKAIAAGRFYHKFRGRKYAASTLKTFIQRYEGTDYAEAAQGLLDAAKESGKEPGEPLAFFLAKDKVLARYEYPPKP